MEERNNEGNNLVLFLPFKRGVSLVHFQRESRGEKGKESCAAVSLVVVAVVIVVVIVVVVVQLGVVGANILLHNRKSNLYLGDKSRRLGKMVDRQGS